MVHASWFMVHYTKIQEISKLSGILVNLLASYQLPSQDVMPFVRDTDKVVPPTDSDFILDFWNSFSSGECQVASVLPSLWARYPSAAMEALNTVYDTVFT